MSLLHVVSPPHSDSTCGEDCRGAAIHLDDSANLSGVAEQAILDALALRPDADAVYGDVEVAGVVERRPAWSPTRLVGEPNAALPMAVRCSTLAESGGDVTDPALPLRLVRNESLVLHIPAVLSVHTRAPAGASRAEVDRHLADLGIAATAVASEPGRLRLVPDPGHRPPVSIVIPTAGAVLGDVRSGRLAVERCLERIAATVRSDLEVILILGDEYSGDPERIADAGLQVRLEKRPPGPFSFSAAANQGVLAARNELVLLLNDDTEMDPGAIDAMAVHFGDPSIGAVGALLRYPDGTIQHAGMVIDDAYPLHPFRGWPITDARRYGATVARDVIAVTGACLMSRRSLLLALGGLSPRFPLSFNDVDLCLKLRRSGCRVIVEPSATLVHHESLTRAAVVLESEWAGWIERWGEVTDPWYHPGYLRPDDPECLHRNADHLEPDEHRDHLEGRDTRLRPRVYHARRASSA